MFEFNKIICINILYYQVSLIPTRTVGLEPLVQGLVSALLQFLEYVQMVYLQRWPYMDCLNVNTIAIHDSMLVKQNI